MIGLLKSARSLLERDDRKRAETLSDFATTLRVVPLSLLAIVIGLLGTVVAWVLLRLIGLFTNVFYFQRWNFSFASPAANHLGYWAVLVPVVG
ncbi:MAG: hypothetical protein ACRD9L_18940, partial [Bryobacteraceae bacterium]